MFSKECKAHLEEVNETPAEHLLFAVKTAVKLQLLVPVLLVHGVAPRFFKETASNTMRSILERK